MLGVPNMWGSVVYNWNGEQSRVKLCVKDTELACNWNMHFS